MTIITVVVILASFPQAEIALAEEVLPPKNLIRIYLGAEKMFNVDWRLLASINKEESTFCKDKKTYVSHQAGSAWIVGPMQICYKVEKNKKGKPKWTPALVQYKEAIRVAREWENNNNVPHNHVSPCQNPVMVACDDVVSIFIAAAYLKDLSAQKGASAQQLTNALGHYNGGPSWRGKKESQNYVASVSRQYQQYCQRYKDVPVDQSDPSPQEDNPEDPRDLLPKVKKNKEKKEMKEMNTIFDFLPKFLLTNISYLVIIALLLLLRPTRIIICSSFWWVILTAGQTILGLLYFLPGLWKGLREGGRIGMSFTKSVKDLSIIAKIVASLIIAIATIALAIVFAVAYGIITALKTAGTNFYDECVDALEKFKDDICVWNAGRKAAVQPREEAEEKEWDRREKKRETRKGERGKRRKGKKKAGRKVVYSH